MLQYVFIRCMSTFASVIMQVMDLYCPESMSFHSGHFYATTANGISVGLAMFTLISLYIPIRKDIARFRPGTSILKQEIQFLSVKVFIFIQIWLAILIKVLVAEEVIGTPVDWSSSQYSIFIQSTIICFEMLLASVLHIYAFDYAPYRTACPTGILAGIQDSFHLLDIYSDFATLASIFGRGIWYSHAANGAASSPPADTFIQVLCDLIVRLMQAAPMKIYCRLLLRIDDEHMMV